MTLASDRRASTSDVTSVCLDTKVMGSDDSDKLLFKIDHIRLDAVLCIYLYSLTAVPYDHEHVNFPFKAS